MVYPLSYSLSKPLVYILIVRCRQTSGRVFIGCTFCSLSVSFPEFSSRSKCCPIGQSTVPVGSLLTYCWKDHQLSIRTLRWRGKCLESNRKGTGTECARGYAFAKLGLADM